MLNANIHYLLAHNATLATTLLQVLNVSVDELKTLDNASVTGNQLLSIEKHSNVTIHQLLTVNLAVSHTISTSIKMLILDVDGVMTNGGMYYSESGDEFKRFNTKDGYAVRELTKRGFEVGIISNGKNINLITQRATLLGIKNVYVGKADKLEILNKWCATLNIALHEVAHIGDDLNDLTIMRAVGFSACPADACLAIKNTASVTLTTNGGYGCVREFYDRYLSSN
ncbi:MAG: HAD-IIIA family hydrolase [Bacteroidia bacterium]